MQSNQTEYYHYLLNIHDIYTQNEQNYNFQSAFNFFNSFSSHTKNEIIKEYLRTFDSRILHSPDQTFRHSLFGFIFSSYESLFKVFSLYENFNEIVKEYISDPDCTSFSYHSTIFNNVFDYIKIENKDVFLKFIFGKHFSINLFLNCINFDFSEIEKQKLLKLLFEKKINNLNLSQQKLIFQKLGYFYSFLNFNFNKNNIEEFLFFNQHINILELKTEQKFYGKEIHISKLPENNINNKIFHNFFYTFLIEFNYDFFFIFAKDNPNLYIDIKDFFISRDKFTKPIFEKIDCMLSFENF